MRKEKEKMRAERERGTIIRWSKTYRKMIKMKYLF